MAQHIQLQQVVLHGVVFKVRSDDIGVGIIRRVLDRAEIVDLHIAGNDDHTAGVLTGGALDAHTALGQPVDLRRRSVDAPLLQILFRIAKGGLFRHGAHCSGTEHMALAEQLKGIAVGLGLIFTGEVQIDIRHFLAAKPQESLKRNIETILDVLCAADRAPGIRHIRAAAVVFARFKIGVFALRTAVMGGE